MSEKFAYFAAYEQQCQQANKPIVGHHVSCDPNQALLQLLWQVGGIAAVDRQLTLPPSMRLRKDLGSEMAGLWKIPWVRRQRLRFRRPLQILTSPVFALYTTFVIKTSTWLPTLSTLLTGH